MDAAEAGAASRTRRLYASGDDERVLARSEELPGLILSNEDRLEPLGSLKTAIEATSGYCNALAKL
jgi:hypothetical protein